MAETPTPPPSAGPGRHVQVKSAREQMQAALKPPPSELPQTVYADRALLTAEWYDRKAGANRRFDGEIRVLGAPELMRASMAFIRVTGGVTYDVIPTEIRNRLWPQAKLTIMLEGQRGADVLIDACDYDRALLAMVMGEVDKLEADCFRNILEAGEGVEGSARVVVTSRPSVATPNPAAPPR